MPFAINHCGMPPTTNSWICRQEGFSQRLILLLLTQQGTIVLLKHHFCHDNSALN